MNKGTPADQLSDDECERLWMTHCAQGDEHVHPHSIHRYTDAVRAALATKPAELPCAKCGKLAGEHPGPRGKEHAFVHPTESDSSKPEAVGDE